MKKNHLTIATLLLLSLMLTHCDNKKKNIYQYSFRENEQGIELLENNSAVLFYQRAVKSLNGRYARNNYIHPLYSLDGDTLTEDFPSDHPHQRGIFWAWHQILADTTHIGDGWALKNFITDVVEVATSAKKDTALIHVLTLYKSPIFNNKKPYLDEHTLMKIYRPDDNSRIIDFTISLHSLVPRLFLGGSDDEKGYGGFSIRMRMPENLKFLTQKGYVKPQIFQIDAGSWMDFSAPFGKDDKISGMTLFCDRQNPGYPQPWIIRQKSSMQNIVWPGRKAMEIPKDKALILHYRLLIHNGNGKHLPIKEYRP